MTTEIPEVFRCLLEHPFTLPNFDYDGKRLSKELHFSLGSLKVLCRGYGVCPKVFDATANHCHIPEHPMLVTSLAPSPGHALHE